MRVTLTQFQITTFKLNETVRIKAYSKDDPNGYGRIISTPIEDGKYWVSNMNMPFYGTISAFMDKSELGKKTDD